VYVCVCVRVCASACACVCVCVSVCVCVTPPLPLQGDCSKLMYIRSGNVIIKHAYVSVLARACDTEFCRTLLLNGVDSVTHLHTDAYYDALLAESFSSLGELPIEDDGHGFEIGIPALRAAARTRQKFRGFVLEQSFSWGCCPIKYKKPSAKRPTVAHFQGDCPRRSHMSHAASGAKTSCTWTVAFSSEEEKEQILVRFKYWLSQCSRFTTKKDHAGFRPTFENCPENVGILKLADVWDETDDERLPACVFATKPPRKRKRDVGSGDQSHARGRGRGRGSAASGVVAAASSAGSGESTSSSDSDSSSDSSDSES
jgi:hypothetical protein